MEVARELALVGWRSHRIIAHIESHLGGFELNPFLCELSLAFLNIALYEHVSKTGRLLKPQIVQGDALSNAPNEFGESDVVISTPPYRKLSSPLVPQNRARSHISCMMARFCVFNRFCC